MVSGRWQRESTSAGLETKSTTSGNLVSKKHGSRNTSSPNPKLFLIHSHGVEPQRSWRSLLASHSKPVINPPQTTDGLSISIYIMPVVYVFVDFVNLALSIVFPSQPTQLPCVRRENSSSDGDDRLFKLLIIGLKRCSFASAVFRSPAKSVALFDHRFRRIRLLTLWFLSFRNEFLETLRLVPASLHALMGAVDALSKLGIPSVAWVRWDLEMLGGGASVVDVYGN